MGLTLFDSIIVLFIVAVFVASVFRYFRLPSILGYILIGIFVGPHALGWISDRQDVRDIAEFGVVFLLFTIGLEFSLQKLIAMKSTVLGFGSLQVLLSTIVTTVIGIWIGLTPSVAIIIGAIVAMSSTAIVMKQLSEQLELNSPHGLNALGILLLQDLAVIPFLILIPSLQGSNHETILADLLWALLKSSAAILLIFSVGRWLLRPLFQRISTIHSTEIFTLTILLIVLSAAWLTNQLGLSLALGAFIAGMMLGETEFRHQINVEIRPFRDVLLGLFFITIGMQLNLHALPQTWPWVLLLLFALIIFKTALIMTIGIVMKKNAIISLRSGLVLAQGGEFGFALLFSALNYQLLPNDYAQVILSALLLSMVISPIIIRYNGKIANLLLPLFKKSSQKNIKQQLSTIADGLNEHIIICGYGPTGKGIANICQKEHLAYVALDLDPAIVRNAQFAGENVTYGDATRHEIMVAAGIESAKIIIVCVRNNTTTHRILELIHRINRNISVLVRAKDDSELEILQKLGATEIVPDTMETTLVLSSHLLLLVEMPASQVKSIINTARINRYPMLRPIYPERKVEEAPELLEKYLHELIITQNAPSVGKSLASFELEKIDIDIIAMRRSGIHYAKPDLLTELFAGDILILFGTNEDFTNAKRILLGR